MIAVVGMFAAYYFIDRHVLIGQLGANGRVPLWDSFMFARVLVDAGFDANPSGKAFTLVAAVFAGIVGYKETARPGASSRQRVHPEPAGPTIDA